MKGLQSGIAPRDRKYMQRLYERYAGLMFSAALSFGVSEAAAEDIVSAGMLSLMRKVDTLRKLREEKLKAYIVTTVRRTAIAILSRDSLRRAKEIEAAEGDGTERGAFGLAEQLIEEDELDAVLGIIERLPAKERACVKLKYLLDMSDKQIALETGLSPGSVRKYLSRAKEKIRSEIDVWNERRV